MTVLGQHTIEETKDLMKQIEWRIRETDRINNLITPDQIVQNAAEFSDMEMDWTKFKSRWAAARDSVLDRLFVINVANPLVPATMIACENQFQIIKKAINVSGNETFTKGDLNDCTLRIVKFADKPFDSKDQPMPTGFDPDLLAYKKLDSSIRAGEAAAAAAAAKAKETASSNIGLIVGAGIVGVIGVIVATKVYL